MMWVRDDKDNREILDLGPKPVKMIYSAGSTHVDEDN